MAVIGINYNEGNPETYESVRISYGNLEKEKIFSSGNFVVDWYNLNKWIQNEIEGELKDEHHFSSSSSVDHFIMDGANVVSRYLKIKDGKPVLESEYDFMDEGTEFFIPEGENWTWEQLKEYVKNES
jgi:hypothetical protein